jgi:hypothetical protein
MNQYGDINKNKIETNVSRFEVLLAALGLSVVAGALAAAAVIEFDTISLQLVRILAATVAAFGAGALLWESVRWEKPGEQYSSEKENAYQPVTVKVRSQRDSRAA